MGWDAYSSAKTVYNERSKQIKIVDPKIRKLFKDACKSVSEKCQQVDGLLDIGGLDVSTCAYMLEKATGKDCWDGRGWDAEMVKQLNSSANWDFEYPNDEAWAYWSARKFLEVCASTNLSIGFSF